MHEVLLFNRIFNPCSLTKGHWYAIQNKWTKINWDKKLTTTNIKDLSGNSGNRFKKIYTRINVQWKMFDLIYLVCSVPVRLFLWAVAISAISTNNRQQGQTLMIWAAHWTKQKFQVKISPWPKFHHRIQRQRFNFHSSSLAKQLHPCDQSQAAVCFPD